MQEAACNLIKVVCLKRDEFLILIVESEQRDLYCSCIFDPHPLVKLSPNRFPFVESDFVGTLIFTKDIAVGCQMMSHDEVLFTSVTEVGEKARFTAMSMKIERPHYLCPRMDAL